MSMTRASDRDPPEARELRARLVDDLVRDGNIRTTRVRDALVRVPRHLFVPAHVSLERAYANMPLSIGCGQTISQPTVVAVMTEALDLAGCERVLEIGTGSGYQAAVLSRLASEVFTVEFFPELAGRASRVLSELGYSNVHLRSGDGSLGWPEHAPFDRIIATAAASMLPRAWLDQLSDGGVLVAPVETDWGQDLSRYRKRGENVDRDFLGPVWFVPLLSPTAGPVPALSD
jgi:protein-L-isoaspartate(D-aspartate) O-methyltransferase